MSWHESKNEHNMNWHEFFLTLADHASKKSKDPSTKVGAVLVDDDNRVVSIGYNGFARGTADDKTLYLNRPKKHRRILHAECNALLFADRPGKTLYITHPPCSQCTAMAIQRGVKQIIYNASRHLSANWEESFNSAIEMTIEARVGLYKYYSHNDKLEPIYKGEKNEGSPNES